MTHLVGEDSNRLEGAGHTALEASRSNRLRSCQGRKYEDGWKGKREKGKNKTSVFARVNKSYHTRSTKLV